MHYLCTAIFLAAFSAAPVPVTQPAGRTPHETPSPRNATQPPAIRRDSCVHYDPEVVRLSGRLSIDPEYGHPNYGENPATDEKLHVAILHLRHSLAVCGDSLNIVAGESLKGLLKVQLNFMNLHSDPMHYAGQRIVVKGTLYRAISGYHFTPVLMSVDSIGRLAP